MENDDRNKRFTIIAASYPICILILQFAGFLLPSNLSWGFHSLAFLSSTTVIIYISLMLIISIFIFTSRYEPFLEKIASFVSLKPFVFLFFSIAAFIAAAIILRIQTPLLGDGYVILNGYENIMKGARELELSRHPGSKLYFYIMIKIFGADTYLGIMDVFLIGEIILGIGFIISSFYTIRLLTTDPRHTLLSFIFILSFPYMQLYFGYVEFYSVQLFFISIYIWAVVAYLQKRVSFVLISILFFLILFSGYLSAVLLVPSLLYLLFIEYKTSGLKNILLGGAVAASLSFLIFSFSGYRLELFLSPSNHSHLLALTQSDDYYQAYSLFSPYHLVDILNLLILNGAPALFLIVLSFIYSRNKFSPTENSNIFIFTGISLILFMFIVKFDLPMAIDWDVIAPLFYVLAVYAATTGYRLLKIHSYRLLSILTVSTMFTSILFFVLNASTLPNINRVKLFLNPQTSSQSGIYQTTFHLAMYYFYERDINNLVDLWKKYIIQFPSDGNGYDKLIQSYWELGEYGYRSIERTFKNWISIDSNNTEAKSKYAAFCFLHGSYYIKLNQYSAAIQKLEEAINFDKNIPGVYNNLGLIYYDFKKYDISINYFKKAIDVDSNYALGYKNMAKSYFATGDTETTISLLKKSIEVNPNLSFAYEDLGRVYETIGEIRKARENYNRAAILGSKTARQKLASQNDP
ncbi:MAG: hypothetical protein C0417_11805 [Chlorobiaceae bacterium]|nr:hypothetical protein [Chlorobiaceae bacterium]